MRRLLGWRSCEPPTKPPARFLAKPRSALSPPSSQTRRLLVAKRGKHKKMPRIHFLNVKQGACSIIEHISDRVTMIDVCNARLVDRQADLVRDLAAASEKGILGNFNQKSYPVNPIAYMNRHGISNIFRFILSRPDMDHMDGIQQVFEQSGPDNFWDTRTTSRKTSVSITAGSTKRIGTSICPFVTANLQTIRNDSRYTAAPPASTTTETKTTSVEATTRRLLSVTELD